MNAPELVPIKLYLSVKTINIKIEFYEDLKGAIQESVSVHFSEFNCMFISDYLHLQYWLFTKRSDSQATFLNTRWMKQMIILHSGIHQVLQKKILISVNDYSISSKGGNNF